VVSHLEAHIRSAYNITEISSIVCLESRGFFFAPIIALRLGLPCVPVRKNGKLPGDKVSVSYQKEYGPDVFEMKIDAFEGISSTSKKVILMDDLLGHGGSIVAAKQLVEKLKMEVLECVFIFDIPDYYETNKKNLGDMKWYAMVHLMEESIGPN
jgi:adenine phosphoribosyltransferase